MREKNHPAIADELVKVNGTDGGVGLEVGSDGTETEGFCAWFGHVEEVM